MSKYGGIQNIILGNFPEVERDRDRRVKVNDCNGQYPTPEPILGRIQTSLLNIFMPLENQSIPVNFTLGNQTRSSLSTM